MTTTAVLLAASLALAPVPSTTAQHDPLAPERALARERYLKVEAELSRASLDALSPGPREARARLLDVLDAYVTRADFGVQSLDPLARLPQFVDFDGRRCAIAELLHSSGEDELLSEVAVGSNTAWIADLAGDARFLGWLDTHGLALDEAARIQGPSMPRFPDAPPPGDTVPAPGAPSSPGGPASPAGPGPSTPAPAGPRSPGPAAPRGPAGAGPTSLGPTAPDGPGGSPSGGGPQSEADSTWWQWWEFNKLEFLRPNRLALAAGADAPGRSTASGLRFMRRAMTPLLLRGVEHRDARIRAAAAGALGRTAGADAVSVLVELLGDSHQSVRDAALLGLGASGASEAQAVLLGAIEHGRAGRVRDLGRRERALALAALGLGRRTGFDESCDQALIALAKRWPSAERDALGVAAMTYALLNPSVQLLELAAECSNDQSWPVSVRCRAAEALRASGEAHTLGELQHLASGSRIELRRSAALALGEFEHPLAVAGLMTAYDLEKEPVASSFLLVSLGRRGGAKAREQLAATLRGKDALERPWAALTRLGSIVADEMLDAAARAAAMDGLGMMLCSGEALALAESARSANYPQFPDWLRDVYATTF